MSTIEQRISQEINRIRSQSRQQKESILFTPCAKSIDFKDK